MIAVSTYNKQRVALFGLGGSGLATAKALMAGGCRVVAYDDNPEVVENARNSGIEVADFKSAGLAEYSALVLAPGVPLTHPEPHWSVKLAKAAKIPIIGDIELFAGERQQIAPDAPFVAVTGTNGKSTCVTLIAHILSHAGRNVQLGGNIGTAVLSLEPLRADRIYVIECSSYQIDLTPGLDPSIGILLNLSPDHLDRHGDMAQYTAIKQRLVAGAGVAIIAVDDERCAKIARQLQQAGHKVITVSKDTSLENGLYAIDGNIYSGENRQIIATIAGIGSLPGAHNAQNALAAIAACIELGLTGAEIQAGLDTFPGLVHRMERVGHLGQTLFVNDSKATNSQATAPALASYDHIYWIAGGLAKDGGIEPLRPWFKNVAKAYLIGEAAPMFSATLGQAVKFEISSTLDLAINHAARDAKDSHGAEPVVLLSPACASFDQFPNFEQRGMAFKKLANSLTGFIPIGGSN